MSKEKPKRINKKTGSIDPGKGKQRPHHSEIRKRVNTDSETTGEKISQNTYDHRLKKEENNYIPRTANKYQTTPKKLRGDGNSVTYEWYEDNGHKDHLQYKRKTVLKEDECQAMVAATITNPTYQENYKEIFGDRKRGVQVKGGFKKFKKTYK